MGKQIPMGGKLNSHWWEIKFPLVGKQILTNEKIYSHQ